ncbi:MAG: carbohydrate ABC transporter permease [Chloroflexota bacterium]
MVGENSKNVWFFLERGFFGVILILFIVYSLFPFVWGVNTSFKTPAEIAAEPLTLVPVTPTADNYVSILSCPFIGLDDPQQFFNTLFRPTELPNIANSTSCQFIVSVRNSFVVATSATVFSLILGGLAAYALGRYRFRGRSLMRYVILAMNLFPTIAVLPSLLDIMSNLGLTETIGSLILTYPIFTLPTIAWSMIVFFQRLPEDIEQAAYVDGANTFQLFTRVLLPIATPVLFTTGIITFIGTLNEYLLALTFVAGTPEARNITVAIKFLGAAITPGELMAMSVVVVVPLILVIYFTQRQAIKETTEGAVKG